MSEGSGDHKGNNNTFNSTQQQREEQQQMESNVYFRMIEHFKANKVDGAMWVLRAFAIIFSCSYFLPIFMNQQSAFNKALLSNAAISALRLHQRIPSFTFSREFLARLFAEDSCHYLMYSLIFLNVQRPIFLVLIPIVLFAVLHAASYSLKLLDIIGQNSWWGARFLISIVEFQTGLILKAAAYSEIFIMPLAIILTFMGVAGLMTPLVYYHFLVMRYSSRRNPYTRNAFTELRMSADALAMRLPSPIGKFIHSCINLISRLAPQPQPIPGQ